MNSSNRFKNQLFIIPIFLIAIILLSIISGCEDKQFDNNVSGVSSGISYLAIAGLNALFLLDLESNELLEQPIGLGNAPNWIVPYGDRLLVINSVSNDMSVIIAENEEIYLERTVDLGLEFNRNPFAAAITGDHRLLVTNLLENSVSVVDLGSYEITQTWETGATPEGIVVDQDYAYVICTGYDFNDYSFNPGELVVHSLADGAIVMRTQMNINSQFAAMDIDKNLFIINTGDYDEVFGSIRILETNTFNNVHTSITDSIYPGRLAASHWGSVYIACGGWLNEGESVGLVLRYSDPDSSSNNQELNLKKIFVNPGAIDVAVDQDNERVFVACYDAQAVDEIRGDSLFTSYSLPENPQAIAIWDLP
ncbi:YncE family protein [Calditrichota bacterium]